MKYPFHDTLFFMTTGQWDMIGESGSYEPTARDLKGAQEAQGVLCATSLNTTRSQEPKVSLTAARRCALGLGQDRQ